MKYYCFSFAKSVFSLVVSLAITSLFVHNAHAQWTNSDDMIINGNTLTSDTYGYASALTADVINNNDGGKVHLNVITVGSYDQVWLGLTTPGSGIHPTGGYYSGFYMDYTIWYRHRTGSLLSEIKIYVGGTQVYYDDHSPRLPSLDIEVTNNQTRFYINNILWYADNGPIPNTLVGVASTNENHVTLSGSIESYIAGQPNLWVEEGNNLVYDGGTVGIGTTSPDTNFGLHVNGNIKTSSGNSAEWNDAYYERGSQIAGTGLEWSADKLNVVGNSSNWDDAYAQRGSVVAGTGLSWSGSKIDFNGNLINGNGIGWDSEMKRLFVRGNELSGNGINWDSGTNKLLIDGNQLAGTGLTWTGTSFEVSTSSPWTSTSGIISYTAGKVGIGTSTVSADFMMSVDGEIEAEEIVVQVVGVPDYVFHEDYDLLSLDEVADYIDQNSHLPEIPSAAELEESGMSLGEMNLLLLKKIEELTLHLIISEQRVDQLIDRLKVIEEYDKN
ncbi:MAG: hypothetical protein RIF33_08425 [Cyclobacteriaceae bacterium]